MLFAVDLLVLRQSLLEVDSHVTVIRDSETTRPLAFRHLLEAFDYAVSDSVVESSGKSPRRQERRYIKTATPSFLACSTCSLQHSLPSLGRQ
jgi:hypothetical protein